MRAIVVRNYRIRTKWSSSESVKTYRHMNKYYGVGNKNDNNR